MNADEEQKMTREQADAYAGTVKSALDNMTAAHAVALYKRYHEMVMAYNSTVFKTVEDKDAASARLDIARRAALDAARVPWRR